VHRIEVCGGIGSGKTTIAALLAKYSVAPALFENFHANPFWEAFYTDPARYAFETEVTFLLQHYHAVKRAAESSRLFVCDFSFVLDRAYVDVTLRDAKRDAFLAVFDEVQRELDTPSLLVHLRCSAETELARIQQRARASESSISTEYLQSLNDAVERHVEAVSPTVRVVRLDSDRQNFATDEPTRRNVVTTLRTELSGEV